MGKRTDAREKFKQADELFRARDFAKALEVLDDLDREFPDTKNVIYPRAMCLARVGRFDEALELCRQLKVEFGDPRGEKLMVKIGALRKVQLEKEQAKDRPNAAGAAAPPANIYTLDSNPPPISERAKGKNAEFSPVFDPHGAGEGLNPEAGPLGAGADIIDLGDGSPAIDMAALDDLFAAKPAAAPPPPAPPPAPSRKKLYIGAGIAVAVLGLLMLLPLVMRGSGGDTAGPAVPAAQTQQAEADQAAQPQFDGPPISWYSSIEEASSASGDSGQNVLLLFYSSSTPSSDLDLMESSVWTDPTIRYFAQNWVCAKIDVDKDPSARDRFGITKLPTTVITDYALEEPFFQQEGFLDTQQFYTAVMDYGLAPSTEDESMGLPKLPTIALVLLPVVFLAATFFPVLFTLLILGRMPEDDPVTSLLGIMLVSIVAPFLGWRVLRAAFQLEMIELLLYYGLLAVHLFVAERIMTLVSQLDMPFFLYLYAAFLEQRLG